MLTIIRRSLPSTNRFIQNMICHDRQLNYSKLFCNSRSCRWFSQSYESNDSGSESARIFINDQIKFPLIRVMDEKGYIGDMSTLEAQELARERGMDLILVSPTHVPPVCKITSLARHVETLTQNLNRSAPPSTMNDPSSQFAFDPTARIRVLTFSAVEQEQEVRRKLQWARDSLKKGHRVELTLERRGASANQTAERALRLVSELKDLCKPVGLPLDLVAYAKSAVSFKLWPCTPEQAATFRLPVISMSLPEDDPTEAQRGKSKKNELRRTRDYRQKYH